MSNHVDRFYAAVSVLAGHGNIKQRLIRAYEENLAAVDVAQLPIAIKQPYSDLKYLMSQVEPLNGEGRIRASVRKMSTKEADACAQKIIDLFRDVASYGKRLEEPLPSRKTPRPAIPPFLVKSG